MIKKVFPLLGR